MEKTKNVIENIKGLIEKGQNHPILRIEILGNSLFEWATALVVFILIIVFLKILKTILVFWFRKMGEHLNSRLSRILADAIDSLCWPLFVALSLKIVVSFLNVNSLTHKIVFYIFWIAIAFYSARAVTAAIDLGVKRLTEEKTDEETDKINSLLSVLKVFIWAIAITVFLANVGFNVSALLAGLGIGGLALAMASQQIAQDIIGAFTLFFDKPFKIGDNIIVGDMQGKVSRVGLRSVRMKGAEGEEIIIANSEMAKSKIKNFGKI